MDWKEARDNTIGLWRNINDAIDRADELELLTEINAICDLCVVAKEESPESLDRCQHCLAYQQFGGCREVNAEMSAKVVDKDWEGLRSMIDGFIAHLQAMDVEPTARVS